MSEETFVKSSSLLFPSSEGLGVGSALCPLPSALFLESHCKFHLTHLVVKPVAR
ncbi:MAG: hypothetical protein F6K14_27085 [Symploca sp. SIO2C1]|nr:hypothetical protein [Symploca sp. SIO2C1]